MYIITVPADWFSEVTAEDIYCDISTISRQRLGKHIPEVTLSTVEGYQLLGIGTIRKHSVITMSDKNVKCSLCGPRARLFARQLRGATPAPPCRPLIS
jgi:hypothetical protein